MIAVLEMMGGGEGKGENTGTTDGIEYESGILHFRER
jgi:hypothetical protein